MIQYTLKCENDHRFSSWFQSASAFDKLKSAGMVVCDQCGSGKVEKALMAPTVRPARKAAAAPATQEAAPAEKPLSTPANEMEEAIAKMRQEVEANSDYVGTSFASEARAMHDGDAPARSIYGEAKIEDAKELLEEGVPVVPLPFRTQKNTN